jgi:queuosine precursor transporter
MIHNIIKNKSTRLFLVLGGFFIANALLAEIIGVKLFSLEKTLGLPPADILLFGNRFSFNLTAGVVLWPVVFIMTDIINEYYGPKGVRFLSFLAIGLIAYAFIMFSASIRLVPADFWAKDYFPGVPESDKAFRGIFGQSQSIIIASLIAFLVSQVLDVFIFHRIKKVTGDRLIWLRATLSTLVSQLIDSFLVLFIAFYAIPQGKAWTLTQVLSTCTGNYIYKFVIAILLTPVIYLVHAWIERYLGKDLAGEMKAAAME